MMNRIDLIKLISLLPRESSVFPGLHVETDSFQQGGNDGTKSHDLIDIAENGIAEISCGIIVVRSYDAASKTVMYYMINDAMGYSSQPLSGYIEVVTSGYTSAYLYSQPIGEYMSRSFSVSGPIHIVGNCRWRFVLSKNIEA